MLEALRIAHPFLVRTVDPPVEALAGEPVTAVGRLGKRIVLSFPRDRHLALHLMIAGRLHWRERGAALRGRSMLLALDFAGGTLVLSEAGTKRRAALHVVRGAAGLASLDRGGLEVLAASPSEFRAALARANHTLKRALTDPRIFAGIGNAYSDEILHAARASPFALTGSLTDLETERLYQATRATLTSWIARLEAQAGGRFPEGVTAFRPEMAVHGRYGRPCPVCGAPVQRVRYAENEMNYCARCQTGGRVFADRALSRLLKADWPRSLEEWEEEIGVPGATPSPSTPGRRGAGSSRTPRRRG